MPFEEAAAGRRDIVAAAGVGPSSIGFTDLSWTATERVSPISAVLLLIVGGDKRERGKGYRCNQRNRLLQAKSINPPSPKR